MSAALAALLLAAPLGGMYGYRYAHPVPPPRVVRPYSGTAPLPGAQQPHIPRPTVAQQQYALVAGPAWQWANGVARPAPGVTIYRPLPPHR